MATRKIRKYGAQVLRKKSLPVEDISKTTIRIIRDMEETLKKKKGIGLAAVQIGVLQRIFIAWDAEKKKLIHIINPEILETGSSEIDMEGCLSFPEIYFGIQRPTKLTISGFNPKGKKIIIEAKELLARCFSHECDHLNGILIIDYASEEEKKYWKEKLEKLEK